MDGYLRSSQSVTIRALDILVRGTDRICLQEAVVLRRKGIELVDLEVIGPQPVFKPVVANEVADHSQVQVHLDLGIRHIDKFPQLKSFLIVVFHPFLLIHSVFIVVLFAVDVLWVCQLRDEIEAPLWNEFVGVKRAVQ